MTQFAIDTTVDGIDGVQRNFEDINTKLGELSQFIFYGIGSPEGVVTAACAIYIRLDGGAGTTLYVKEDPTIDNTGWVAK